MTRKKACEILAPRRNNELDDITKGDIDHFNEKFPPLLMVKINRKVQSDPKFRAEFERSKSQRERIFSERKLPALKDLVSLCRQLDCTITFSLYPYIEADQRSVRALQFSRTLSMTALLKLMNSVHGSKREFDTKQMIKVREEILLRLEAEESKLHLKTIIRFFNACGYQLSMCIKDQPQTKN